jgi:RNA polymerase sigma factor (TIGR02999 family)
MMERSGEKEISRLLAAWSEGDQEALDSLAPEIYGELRRLSRRELGRRGRRGETLQTTALIHEAFLRLVDQDRVSWRNRAHFFAVAAQMMRRIVVDHARRRRAAKRGGGVEDIPLDVARFRGEEPDFDLLALDEALGQLARLDPLQGRLVELRYFAGLTIEEVAEVLSVSPATVKREWTAARTWLFYRLSEGAAL